VRRTSVVLARCVLFPLLSPFPSLPFAPFSFLSEIYADRAL
jgi:adenylylsulfate kinase